MRIGILEAGDLPEHIAAEYGDYPAMFARLLDGRGYAFRTWAVHAGDVPEDPGEMDGWLITGSRHGVYEDHPWIPPLEAFVRRCVAENAPLVGICFGHQIMAQALGGEVVKSDRGWCIGAHVYEDLETGGAYCVNALHQDQVVRAPEGARLIARSDFCPIAGLSYGPNAASWQPHPEIRPEFLERLVRARRGKVYPEAVADGALAALGTPLDTPAMADRMARVLEGARVGDPG